MDGDLMFERYTDRARRVIVLAQEEARMGKNSRITVPSVVDSSILWVVVSPIRTFSGAASTICLLYTSPSPRD